MEPEFAVLAALVAGLAAPVLAAAAPELVDAGEVDVALPAAAVVGLEPAAAAVVEAVLDESSSGTGCGPLYEKMPPTESS